MSLPPDEIGAIAKSFPHIRAKHITAALTELPELRRSRLNGNQLATIFSIAQQLDGLPRHVAMHPCGVLLSDKTLLDRTAVQASAEGFPLSQLDKDDAEIAGVIKLDVLGVRMQSAMAHTLTEIERTENERIDLDAMPRDDPATYAMIGRSETIGCFQIESPGQRELVKKLAPRDVADLIVDISLFRPGPVNSDMIGPFLRTRHGLAEPRYPHEKLEKALKETGGVVVFHEQVLRIIDVMTGCGLAEADLVRRHLSDRRRPGPHRPVVPRPGPGPRLRPGDGRAGLAGGRRVRRLRLLQGPRRRLRDPRLPVGLAQTPPSGRLLRRRPHPRPRHVPQARHHRRRPPVRRPGPPNRHQRLISRLEGRKPIIPNDSGLLPSRQFPARRPGRFRRADHTPRAGFLIRCPRSRRSGWPSGGDCFPTRCLSRQRRGTAWLFARWLRTHRPGPPLAGIKRLEFRLVRHPSGRRLTSSPSASQPFP